MFQTKFLSLQGSKNLICMNKPTCKQNTQLPGTKFHLHTRIHEIHDIFLFFSIPIGLFINTFNEFLAYKNKQINKVTTFKQPLLFPSNYISVES